MFLPLKKNVFIKKQTWKIQSVEISKVMFGNQIFDDSSSIFLPGLKNPHLLMQSPQFWGFPCLIPLGFEESLALRIYKIIPNLSLIRTDVHKILTYQFFSVTNPQICGRILNPQGFFTCYQMCLKRLGRIAKELYI